MNKRKQGTVTRNLHEKDNLKAMNLRASGNTKSGPIVKGQPGTFLGEGAKKLKSGKKTRPPSFPVTGRKEKLPGYDRGCAKKFAKTLGLAVVRRREKERIG